MPDLRRPPTTTGGPIDLRLPADPSMSKVLRLAASGVASLSGFDVEEIEEIKLAVSEVLIALVEHGSADHVDLQFVASSDEFIVHGSTVATSAIDEHAPDLALCRAVLTDVCTEHDLTIDDEAVRITATLRRPFAGL
jgi:anti-sigma regulatory factor (Ser/Thr protein kinase)